MQSRIAKSGREGATFIEARFALAQALLAHGDFRCSAFEFETVVKAGAGSRRLSE